MFFIFRRRAAAAAVLAGLALCLGAAWVLAAATAQDSLYYRLVGLVNSSGTQTSPATEDTLALVSAAVGGGETPTIGSPTALADGVTTAVASRSATKKLSVRALDLTATAATRVWLYKIAANGDATTLNVGWETAATGGRIFAPRGNFLYWQAPAGSTISAKSVGGASAIQVWYVEE